MKQSPLMQEIVDVVGLAAAVRLVEAKGGQRIFIPRTVPSDHWLAQLLGEEKAGLLAAYFNHETGNKIDLPSSLRFSQAEREKRFRQLVAEGRSANQIAGAQGFSRRWVFEKKKKLKIKSRQADLFEPKTPKG